ncbi:PREDICTED: uncharacterized protein LOC108373109 isoform X1 [Rhagoletis zephyria]|uniref:uncharacterized protein LOC108373109 isoform X1 n=1 Tax=Rhagoletis zephyria TaxID=28612 RepID=UPI00081195F7|nr:PREDICTED: uncharacterized protein LOC108373109 isoform X1 [Rhagoletis zephyria]XP_017484454.1 PREDICTED: uncharacterized protein LOC108373109 isoform X1 [Rhagoletis zephyria]
MFGSKLRSWMENHIGRPRKKGAKNKTANSAASAANAAGCSHEAYQHQSSNSNKKLSSAHSSAIFTLHHAHGNGAPSTSTSITANNSSVSAATSAAPTMTTVMVAPGAMSSFSANHHIGGGGGGGSGGGSSGCGSVISSPVRRREVSPIQGHTQSRYGWQSPDQETVTSPKSDNFLYAPQHRVRSQSHHSNYNCSHQQHPYTAPNSKDNSSDDRSLQAKSYTPTYGHHLQPLQHPQHQPHQQQQTQLQPNTLQQQQQPHPADCSSSSISSLSWSTGSKEPSMNSSSNHNNNNTHHSSSNNNSSLSKPQPCEPKNISATDLQHFEEDPNTVHYEEIRTILRHPEHCSSSYNNTNPFLMHERPKSEQLTSFTPVRSLYADRRSQDDASTRYGRLLPSKIQSCSNSNDSLNANASLTYIRSGSAEYISQQYHHPGASAMGGAAGEFGANHQSGHSGGLASMHCQRSRLRGGRFGNGHALNGAQQVAGGVAVAGAPLHSLSSPESAYSTGYSTDGTSPGAIYTPPEYYINMRTGTHYFPKSVNSLAIEAQRYKFGLNKIEEMSPIDPMPKTSFANASGLYKRADSYDMGQGCGNNNGMHHEPFVPLDAPHGIQHPGNVGRHSPLALRNAIVLPTLKGFESPSPRQRCRIRTNPWYLTMEANAPATGSVSAQNVIAFLPPPPPTQPPPTAMSTTSDTSTISSSAHSTMTPEALGTPLRQPKPAKTSSTSGSAGDGRRELDAASTSSSGKRSSNATTTDGRGQQTSDKHNEGLVVGTAYESSESSSSLTEVENMQRSYTPNTVRRKRAEQLQAKVGQPLAAMLAGVCVIGGERAGGGSNREPVASDDDATLNEMMGKFDESYVYEKETDILSSDSDPTDCHSDLDTGQDAGDECDTDELLDIDFIDTSSMHELSERKELESNLGSCCYYKQSPKRGSVRQHSETRASVRSRQNSRNTKHMQEVGGAAMIAPGSCSQRRRKRFLKTRKKSAENRTDRTHSPHKPRQTRSVGGTPVCVRRQRHITAKNRIYETSPLTNRSSSLVFMDVRDTKRFMTIAESERALLKADLEADVKYRQLIQEAESILVSMKNSMQSIPRDTPVSSPRRVNPIANKRVEMLKNCEADTRREQLKQAQQRSLDAAQSEKHQQQQQQQELAAAINRRIDLLRHAPASAPNSPRFSRCSPRKTHLTNFINQNVPPEVPVRKSLDAQKPPQSPQLQLNGRRMQHSPTATPQQQRRFRSQSPVSRHKQSGNLQRTENFDSDSDTESQQLNGDNQFKVNDVAAVDAVNHNYLPEFARISRYNEADLRNHNVAAVEGKAGETVVHWQSGLMHACPQSEPLKRKVYSGSSTFERIKKSFDLEAEIPKQAMLTKIHNLRRRERQNSNPRLNALGSSQELPAPTADGSVVNGDIDCAGLTAHGDHKKKMILSTLADLKRSLETQSVELNGLNDD